jgi:hypothetical protein
MPYSAVQGWNEASSFRDISTWRSHDSLLVSVNVHVLKVAFTGVGLTWSEDPSTVLRRVFGGYERLVRVSTL